MISGCEWCLDFGSAISADAGVSEEDLGELPTYATNERIIALENYRSRFNWAFGIEGQGFSEG